MVTSYINPSRIFPEAYYRGKVGKLRNSGEIHMKQLLKKTGLDEYLELQLEHNSLGELMYEHILVVTKTSCGFKIPKIFWKVKFNGNLNSYYVTSFYNTRFLTWKRESQGLYQLPSFVKNLEEALSVFSDNSSFHFVVAVLCSELEIPYLDTKSLAENKSLRVRDSLFATLNQMPLEEAEQYASMPDEWVESLGLKTFEQPFGVDPTGMMRKLINQLRVP